MILLDFLMHLKHNSIKFILLSSNNTWLYKGCLGTYIHFVNKNKFDNCLITFVEFHDGLFLIHLDII